MKLYLSSYRFGNNADVLAESVTGKKRIGLICNALDFSDEKEKLAERRTREMNGLQNLGLMPEEINLKDYFNTQHELKDVVERLDGLWVVGGNAFILRQAMHLSGLDEILQEKCRDEHFVYAGYSAGICVLAPTLRGIHLVDDPDLIPEGYHEDIIWEGLSLLPFCIAPHYRSDHPESELIEQSVAFFIDNKIPFIALRDGEVYIADTRQASTYPPWNFSL